MSGYNPKIHHRRSIRLKGYDYSLEAAYFVTIATYQQVNLFGQIIDGKVQLNTYGKIASDQWLRLKQRFFPTNFSIFVIMPNHMHGVIHIIKSAGKESQKEQTQSFPQRSYGPIHSISGSLGTIVRAYKSAVSYRINAIRKSAQPPVWQRNYYEHIIRSEKEYKQIKDYIETNPASWMEDGFYPR